MKKVLEITLAFLGFLFVFPGKALAFCPMCTVAVAAGLGLSRYLGIDDSISGIWIGGLILSFSLWFADWLEKKNIKFKYHQFLVAIFVYALVILPLWATGIIGHPFNTVLGIDKLIFGMAVGSIIFLGSMYADRRVRKIKGKQLFLYQKVVFPVAALAIISLIMYFYGGYLYG
jgi:hypothetical protein